MRRTLAADMRNSELGLRDAERRVEELLFRLFPTWDGWSFTAPDEISVYTLSAQSAGSHHAIRTLFAEGFATIQLHTHRAARALTCVCAVHEPGRDR